MAGFYLNKDFDHLHIYPGSGTQTSYFYEDNLIPAALDAELPPDELCVLMDAYARLTVKPWYFTGLYLIPARRTGKRLP